MNPKPPQTTKSTEAAGKKGKLRKSELTQQAIVEAAKKFLWTRPFRELTVRELMSATGTSRFNLRRAKLGAASEALCNHR